MDFIRKFEELPKWAKVILILCAGIVPAAIRINRYFETKNEDTLIVGVLCVVPMAGLVIQIIDTISELTDNKIKFVM